MWLETEIKVRKSLVWGDGPSKGHIRWGGDTQESGCPGAQLSHPPGDLPHQVAQTYGRSHRSARGPPPHRRSCTRLRTGPQSRRALTHCLHSDTGGRGRCGSRRWRWPPHGTRGRSCWRGHWWCHTWSGSGKIWAALNHCCRPSAGPHTPRCRSLRRSSSFPGTPPGCLCTCRWADRTHHSRLHWRSHITHRCNWSRRWRAGCTAVQCRCIGLSQHPSTLSSCCFCCDKFPASQKDGKMVIPLPDHSAEKNQITIIDSRCTRSTHDFLGFEIKTWFCPVTCPLRNVKNLIVYGNHTDRRKLCSHGHLCFFLSTLLIQHICYWFVYAYTPKLAQNKSETWAKVVLIYMWLPPSVWRLLFTDGAPSSLPFWLLPFLQIGLFLCPSPLEAYSYLAVHSSYLPFTLF